MFSNDTTESGPTPHPIAVTVPPHHHDLHNLTTNTTEEPAWTGSAISGLHRGNKNTGTTTMSVYFMIAAVLGLLLSVSAILLFVYLIRKRNFQFDFPENSTSIQVLFLLGTCALFLVTAFHIYHPEHAEAFVCTPLVLCLSCLLAGAVNLRLIRKYEIVLPTWALVFVVIFCTFVTPIVMFNRYDCLVHMNETYVFTARVCGNLSAILPTTIPFSQKPAAGGVDTTYVFIYYIMNVAAGTALFSVKTSCHAKYLCWTLLAVWFLWTSHWCMHGLVASNALLTVNGYIFLTLYVTPSFVFSYKRQRGGLRRRSSYRRAMIVLDGYSGSLAVTDGGGSDKRGFRAMLP
ncbi:G protein-coupled receptor-6.4 [Proboscivirus elephantidbeta4]|uniref:G protein-coupled receptor-6.4 n=1 Tax=Elephant endotheliotropic herpesvirus 4 TaxID=548914 RepID=A0A0S1TPK0_9BETA|nr:G protein-coupled receptor-6.4 [Elephant endotheliotropic herpesvirus 4]ALM25930.1 G protein-coupled receptor-6.4 [Elephant endotheliotropic herpesvirus 4]